MSMDEQFEQMRYFYDALNTFTDRLQASVMDLEQRHVVVDPLWRDEFQKAIRSGVGLLRRDDETISHT